jgi:hypothetical protein
MLQIINKSDPEEQINNLGKSLQSEKNRDVQPMEGNEHSDRSERTTQQTSTANQIEFMPSLGKLCRSSLMQMTLASPACALDVLASTGCKTNWICFASIQIIKPYKKFRLMSQLLVSTLQAGVRVAGFPKFRLHTVSCMHHQNSFMFIC